MRSDHLNKHLKTHEIFIASSNKNLIEKNSNSKFTNKKNIKTSNDIEIKQEKFDIQSDNNNIENDEDEYIDVQY